MKSVMVSIRPKWCELIASGQKTIEVRKTAPKEVPFKCYIYCTKGIPIWLTQSGSVLNDKQYNRLIDDLPILLNGKVIGEFICDCVERLRNPFEDDTEYNLPCTGECCLSVSELEDYGKGKRLYGWHISDLVIYDKPKELFDFYKPCNGDCFGHCKYYRGKEEDCDKPKITRPPQSWCYVEVEE